MKITKSISKVINNHNPLINIHIPVVEDFCFLIYVYTNIYVYVDE